jgi:hypothetical protein
LVWVFVWCIRTAAVGGVPVARRNRRGPPAGGRIHLPPIKQTVMLHMLSRKAALGGVPVARRNRRGFSAEKRIHLFWYGYSEGGLGLAAVNDAPVAPTPSAAGGGRSEARAAQRSKNARRSASPQRFSGTARGQSEPRDGPPAGGRIHLPLINRPYVLHTLFRKAALSGMSVTRRNRRGFSAEKRIHLPLIKLL